VEQSSNASNVENALKKRCLDNRKRSKHNKATTMHENAYMRPSDLYIYIYIPVSTAREFASGNKNRYMYKTAQAKTSARKRYACSKAPTTCELHTGTSRRVNRSTHASQFGTAISDKFRSTATRPATILATSWPSSISTVSHNWRRSQRAACCGSCQNIIMTTTTQPNRPLRKARGKHASCACDVQ
jgi:hypothetical protein